MHISQLAIRKHSITVSYHMLINSLSLSMTSVAITFTQSFKILDLFYNKKHPICFLLVLYTSLHHVLPSTACCTHSRGFIPHHASNLSLFFEQVLQLIHIQFSFSHFITPQPFLIYPSIYIQHKQTLKNSIQLPTLHSFQQSGAPISLNSIVIHTYIDT